ncbi:MAG TPA: hypothetical protein VGL13_03875 [Polyangiaceae bacterium]|jgi:hypothetical protein
MLRASIVGLGFISALGIVSGCGGSSPPPATPTPAAAVAPEKPASATTTAAAPSNADKASTASTTEASSGEKPTRPTHEILQLKDTLFKLNFEESDRGKTAAAACDQKAGDQPKKRSACMSAARDAIDVADGYQVQRAGDDWIWKAVRLRGSKLTTLSKTPFEFADETDNTIVVKFNGKAPRNMPAELKIGVPSDYRIVIPDARYGQLMYEAKVGIASGGD